MVKIRLGMMMMVKVYVYVCSEIVFICFGFI